MGKAQRETFLGEAQGRARGPEAKQEADAERTAAHSRDRRSEDSPHSGQGRARSQQDYVCGWFFPNW